MAQRSSRAPLYIGLAAAGGVGYYLYSAGGSPKVAEKQFESMYNIPISFRLTTTTPLPFIQYRHQISPIPNPSNSLITQHNTQHHTPPHWTNS